MTSASTPVFVDVRQTGPIARITLNRPEKLNAINFEVGLQLYEAFARCEADSAIRAIVLAGAGRAFCSGDELGRERTPDEEGFIMILRTPTTPDLDAAAPIGCEWRPADVW